MPFGYAERVTLSADSLAERWRWLQRPGGSVGLVRHVLTKQESRQQEAGTQVPPPPQWDRWLRHCRALLQAETARVEKRQTSFPVTGHWSTARTAGQYASRCPLWATSPDHTASWEAWLYRLWSALLGPSFLLSWLSCLTENWEKDRIKYICLGCHIII